MEHEFMPTAILSSRIAQLWQCPTTNRTFPTLTPHINWWCGDETINTPCALPGSQGGNGTFVTYPTSAVFIEESTPSSTISTAPSSTSVISSISSPPSTPSAVLIIAATTTTQIPSSSSSNTTATTGGFVASQIPIAIGTGIGVPFGVLALGTLFFRVRSWMRSKQAQREDSAEFGMSGALGIVGVAGAGGGLPGIEEGDAEGGRALGLSDLSGFGKGGERSEGSGSGSGI
ncbi:MAG: hypothetical protein M1827_002940 [Pycnora praestabilis]|nr:MAG: hypothetical protein M1827_002940 [Pycnora praestabilis]